MINGLKKALEVIQKSKDELIKVDPRIALGLSHAEHMINSEIIKATVTKKKIYVVSGFYFYNDNCFELDMMNESLHTSYDEAVKVCEKQFYDLVDGDEKYEIEKDTTEHNKTYFAYDDNTGDRVFLSVTTHKLEV